MSATQNIHLMFNKRLPQSSVRRGRWRKSEGGGRRMMGKGTVRNRVHIDLLTCTGWNGNETKAAFVFMWPLRYSSYFYRKGHRKWISESSVRSNDQCLWARLPAISSSWLTHTHLGNSYQGVTCHRCVCVFVSVCVPHSSQIDLKRHKATACGSLFEFHDSLFHSNPWISQRYGNVKICCLLEVA